MTAARKVRRKQCQTPNRWSHGVTPRTIKSCKNVNGEIAGGQGRSALTMCELILYRMPCKGVCKISAVRLLSAPTSGRIRAVSTGDVGVGWCVQVRACAARLVK